MSAMMDDDIRLMYDGMYDGAVLQTADRGYYI